MLTGNQKNYTQREHELAGILAANNQNSAIVANAKKQAERARARWACISAKTQRGQRFTNTSLYNIATYDRLTTITPGYERFAPITAGREQGETIQKFSKRSRQRMLSKTRKMNKEGLPLPFFVTLTYQRNMQDFKRAKKDLNAFFQVFRRKTPDFRYMWKMEPQKRGAIHFHIAVFIPDNVFPKAFKNKKLKLNWIIMYISHIWNRIAEPENDARLKKLIETEPENKAASFEYEKDRNVHLQVGTNVRIIENWKMFTGYVGKYMKKEISENPWAGAFTKREEFAKIGVKSALKVDIEKAIINPNRYKYQVDRETGELKKQIPSTGRYWGFSRNLDFEAIQTGVIDSSELEILNEFCNDLNDITFAQIVQNLKDSAQRAKKTMRGCKLERRLKHVRNMYESQKRRWAINKEKIQSGYALQFEINWKIALAMREFIPEISVNDEKRAIFGKKTKPINSKNNDLDGF